MFFSPLVYLLLWVLFSLIFLIFTFLTLSALGRQTRFKLRLSVAIISFILGIVCFFGIFSNHSLEKEWSSLFKNKSSLSIPNPLKVLFGDDKPKESSQNKKDNQHVDNHSKEDKPTSIKHDKPKNSTSQSTSDYESKYRLLPSDFNPKAAKGESITKNSGKYKIGKDIQPGHYTITHNNTNIGILEVDNEYGNYVFSNALSAKSETIASKITTYLVDGQTVEIKDMKHVKFTPEPIKYRTNLNTGVWVVGADIAPGSYTVRPGNKYSANFNVQSSKGESKAIEIIGGDSSSAKKSLHIDLKKGDVVLVQGSGTVKLGK